jgi:hypothetical protein
MDTNMMSNRREAGFTGSLWGGVILLDLLVQSPFLHAHTAAARTHQLHMRVVAEWRSPCAFALADFGCAILLRLPCHRLEACSGVFAVTPWLVGAPSACAIIVRFAGFDFRPDRELRSAHHLQVATMRSVQAMLIHRNQRKESSGTDHVRLFNIRSSA